MIGVRESKLNIEHGVLNFLFPFTYKDKHLPGEQFAQCANEPVDFRQKIEDAVQELTDRGLDFEWGLTWIPDPDWVFLPWSFDCSGHLKCIGSPGEWYRNSFEISADFAALVATDGFYFLSEYFRNQPFLRFRMRDRWEVTHQTDGRHLTPPVNVDVTLYLAISQGCMTFRHILQNINIDEVIEMRLAQFRRGLPLRWQSDGIMERRPFELQSAFLQTCGLLLNLHAEGQRDVRRYGTVLELRQLRFPGETLLTPADMMGERARELYGLLVCDEGWRQADLQQAQYTLKGMASHEREGYLRLSQEVTLLLYHSFPNDPSSSAGLPPHNLLDLYQWNLAKNSSRSVASGSAYLESTMVQENLLRVLCSEAKSLIAASRPDRRLLIKLKRRLSLGLQTVQEAFNVFPGMEALSRVRGMDDLHQRVRDAYAVLDDLLADYRSYNNEFAADIFSSVGLSMALFSALGSFQVDASARWRVAASAFVAILFSIRAFKYREALTFMLLLVALSVWLLLWGRLW